MRHGGSQLNLILARGPIFFPFPTWTGRRRREKVLRTKERHFTGHQNVDLFRLWAWPSFSVLTGKVR